MLMRGEMNTWCWTPGICVKLIEVFCVLSLWPCCMLWWSQCLLWHGGDLSGLLSSDSFISKYLSFSMMRPRWSGASVHPSVVGVILVSTPEGCGRREGVTEQTNSLVNGSSFLWHGCIPLSLKIELVTSSSDLSAPCTHFRDRMCWGDYRPLFTCGQSPRVSIMEWNSEHAVWVASGFFGRWV